MNVNTWNSYAEAVDKFTQAIVLCGDHIGEVWEATFSNLGHSYRKQRMYEEAKEAYQRALNLAPGDPLIRASILSSLGFTSQLSGELEQAINYYEKSLGFNPNDRFTLEMLSQAIDSINLPL